MDFRNINWPDVLFITGIGTDVGKSYATGWLAREMATAGLSVITQKFIQTGCRPDQVSIDIECHRRIQGIPLQTVDKTRITAPLSFSYPASPHLAAEIDGIPLRLELATEATAVLRGKYDHVLVEGAGGLMVPLTRDCLTVDYIASQQLPVILVTNGQLGSISDTLLNLEVLSHRGITIFAVIYNPYFDSDKTIAADARSYMLSHVASRCPGTLWFDMPPK